jgi:hypothetical protein
VILPANPRAGGDHLEGGVRTECLLQRCDVGVLEGHDVLVEQLAKLRFGRLGELVRDYLLEPAASTLQHAVHRRRGGVQQYGDLCGRECSTSRRMSTAPVGGQAGTAGCQVRQVGDERQPKALPVVDWRWSTGGGRQAIAGSLGNRL